MSYQIARRAVGAYGSYDAYNRYRDVSQSKNPLQLLVYHISRISSQWLFENGIKDRNWYEKTAKGRVFRHFFPSDKNLLDSMKLAELLLSKMQHHSNSLMQYDPTAFSEMASLLTRDLQDQLYGVRKTFELAPICEEIVTAVNEEAQLVFVPALAAFCKTHIVRINQEYDAYENELASQPVESTNVVAEPEEANGYSWYNPVGWASRAASGTLTLASAAVESASYAARLGAKEVKVVAIASAPHLLTTGINVVTNLANGRIATRKEELCKNLTSQMVDSGTKFALRRIIAIPIDLILIGLISNGISQRLTPYLISQNYSEEETASFTRTLYNTLFYGLLCLQLYSAARSARCWVDQRKDHQEVAEAVDQFVGDTILNPTNFSEDVIARFSEMYNSVFSPIGNEDESLLSTFVQRVHTRSSEIITGYNPPQPDESNEPRIEEITLQEIDRKILK